MPISMKLWTIRNNGNLYKFQFLCYNALVMILHQWPLPMIRQIKDVKELSSYVRRIFNGEI